MPRGRSPTPSGRVEEPAAGPQAGLWGCILKGLIPGLMTGWAPQKHPNYAGQAGSPHPSSNCSPSPHCSPGHLPCHSTSCPRRNAPGPDTHLPPAQAAAGCSNLAEPGSGLSTQKAKFSLISHTGLGCSCLIANLLRR